jgi:hypothetical protein
MSEGVRHRMSYALTEWREWWVKRPYEIGGGISREGIPSDGWQGWEGWADCLSPWHGMGKGFLFGISPHSLPLFPLG